MSSTIDPKLLAKLADPAIQKQLAELLKEQSEDNVVKTYAPFYRAKTGKITKGHALIEKHRESLELTPIYDEEAVKLGLMDSQSKNMSAPSNDAPTQDLNNPDEEELKDLRMRAKNAGIPNWQVKGAARLRGELTKIELKAESAKHDEVVTDDSSQGHN
ncbi:hypothetical protein [Vibrio harveyi]|uniref:hypothetical protein n=1 Tax=Vibrio harveyi TaxID=669 RepID=UPI003D75236E